MRAAGEPRIGGSVVALEHPAEVLVGWYRQVREHPSADDKPRDADVETIRQRVGGREVS
jgi:hypothetical protein